MDGQIDGSGGKWGEGEKSAGRKKEFENPER